MKRSSTRYLHRALRRTLSEELETRARRVGRECGSCSICCTVFGVSALGKATGEPCRYTCDDGRCRIYAKRPRECSEFFCLWRLGIGPDSERPDRVGFVLKYTATDEIVWVIAGEERAGVLDAARDRLTEIAHELRHPVGLMMSDRDEDLEGFFVTDVLGDTGAAQRLCAASWRGKSRPT